MLDKILAVWGTPRTRSTAFLWMMKQRGDFHTFHEPFGKSFYLSEERKSDRAADQAPRADMNYGAILSMLESHIGKEGRSVFIKDLTYHFEGVYDQQFLSHFHNVFLIRDPAKTLPSLYSLLPDFAREEVGYDTQYRMYELVCETSKEFPLIIDADDLATNPRAVVQAFCERVGIPFVEESLQWDNIPSATKLTWWIGGDGHHDNLKKSTGFQTKRFKEYQQVSSVPKLAKAYEECLPYFEKLHANRLRLTN
jgi:adenylylsulfate kinase